MRIGPKRHRIVVESRTDAADATGEPIATWSTFLSAWARIIQGGSREFERGDRVRADVDLVFVIRHRDGLTPKMRVSWDSRLFDVTAVTNPDQRQRESFLFATEYVSA